MSDMKFIWLLFKKWETSILFLGKINTQTKLLILTR